MFLKNWIDNLTRRNKIKSNSLKPEDTLNHLRTLQQNLLLAKLLRHISVTVICLCSFHWHSKIWMVDFYHFLVSGCCASLSSQYRHTKKCEILACTIFLPFLNFKQLFTTRCSNNMLSHLFFFIISCILNIILPILFKILHCSKTLRFPNTWLWITEKYGYYLYAISGCIWQIEITFTISFETGNYLKIDQWWNLKVMEVGCMWSEGKKWS